jgi:hypothetical protein
MPRPNKLKCFLLKDHFVVGLCLLAKNILQNNLELLLSLSESSALVSQLSVRLGAHLSCLDSNKLECFGYQGLMM